MSGINIVHQDGKWITNPHSFPFNDPETKVCFQPGETYKVRFEPKGSWIAGQMAAGVLKPADDPTKASAEPAKVSAEPVKVPPSV